MSGIDIAALRRMVTGIEGNDPQGSFANGRGRETGSGKGSGFGRARSFTLGFAPADAAFPHGLAGDALHEIFAENPGAHMVATGFALAFAARAANRSARSSGSRKKALHRNMAGFIRRGFMPSGSIRTAFNRALPDGTGCAEGSQ